MMFLPFIMAHKRLVAGIGVLFVVLIIALGLYAKGRSDANKRNEAAKAIAIAEAVKLDSKAKEHAATQRLKDAEQVADLKEQLTDAVAQVPDTVPDPVAVQLGCQRLRNSGADVSKLPACSGPTGQTQASPVR